MTNINDIAEHLLDERQAMFEADRVEAIQQARASRAGTHHHIYSCQIKGKFENGILHRMQEGNNPERSILPTLWSLSD